MPDEHPRPSPRSDPWCDDECELRRAPGFEDFAEDEVGFMCGFKVEHRRVPAGSALFRQGDAPTHLFTLFHGWAYRAWVLEDGKQQILGLMLPGDLAGVAGAASGRHHYTLVALTDVDFCCLHLGRLPELFRAQEGLTRRLLWLSGLRVREADRHQVRLGRCTAEEALADFILDLHARLGRRGLLDADGRGFALPMSQALIAEYLGVTQVHLSRLLGRLRAEGVLAFRRQKIEALDLEALRRRSCLRPLPVAEDGARRPFL